MRYRAALLAAVLASGCRGGASEAQQFDGAQAMRRVEFQVAAGPRVPNTPGHDSIGRWLERFGESIYGTRGGPYRAAAGFASTCRENRVYLHVLNPEAKLVRIRAIPGRTLRRASMLGGSYIPARTDAATIELTLPEGPLDRNDAVIVLDLDGSAESIAPMDIKP